MAAQDIGRVLVADCILSGAAGIAIRLELVSEDDEEVEDADTYCRAGRQKIALLGGAYALNFNEMTSPTDTRPSETRRKQWQESL